MTDADIGKAPDDFSQKIEVSDVAMDPSELKTPEKLAKLDSKVSSKTKKGSQKLDKYKKSSKQKESKQKKSEDKVSTKVEAKTSTPGKASTKSKGAKISLGKNWPVSIGEKIKMTLRWGPVEGGVVTLRVKEPKGINGVPVIHYSGTVKSSKMLDLFYKIDNSIDTWARASDLAPLRQEIKQLESARYGRRVLIFDPEKNKVKFYEHMTKKNGEVKEERKIDDMIEGAQDLFGAFYFYRYVQHLPKGFKFPIHDKGKNWFAEMRFVGNETLRVPAGLYETKHYQILPKLEGQLKPKGEVDVWLSDDDRNVLVQFKAKIKVGSITGELIEYEGGREPPFDLPVWKTPVQQHLK